MGVSYTEIVKCNITGFPESQLTFLCIQKPSIQVLHFMRMRIFRTTERYYRRARAASKRESLKVKGVCFPRLSSGYFFTPSPLNCVCVGGWVLFGVVWRQ